LIDDLYQERGGRRIKEEERIDEYQAGGRDWISQGVAGQQTEGKETAMERFCTEKKVENSFYVGG
jgi:hypothetical protein